MAALNVIIDDMAALSINDGKDYGEVNIDIRLDWKKKLKVPELRKLLDSLHLNNKGKRNILVKRLDQFIIENNILTDRR